LIQRRKAGISVALASLIDWDVFEREWAGFFPSTTGRPATSPRLVAGLLYLQHAFRLSDEAVVARRVENPYYRHLTGETFLQHKPPIDPTSLIRWRKRIGEEGVEWLLTKTIEAGRKSGVCSTIRSVWAAVQRRRRPPSAMISVSDIGTCSGICPGLHG
jgi:hypothetical protein